MLLLLLFLFVLLNAIVFESQGISCTAAESEDECVNKLVLLVYMSEITDGSFHLQVDFDTDDIFLDEEGMEWSLNESLSISTDWLTPRYEYKLTPKTPIFSYRSAVVKYEQMLFGMCPVDCVCCNRASQGMYKYWLEHEGETFDVFTIDHAEFRYDVKIVFEQGRQNSTLYLNHDVSYDAKMGIEATLASVIENVNNRALFINYYLAVGSEEMLIYRSHIGPGEHQIGITDTTFLVDFSCLAELDYITRVPRSSILVGDQFAEFRGKTWQSEYTECTELSDEVYQNLERRHGTSYASNVRAWTCPDPGTVHLMLQMNTAEIKMVKHIGNPHAVESGRYPSLPTDTYLAVWVDVENTGNWGAFSRLEALQCCLWSYEMKPNCDGSIVPMPQLGATFTILPGETYRFELEVQAQNGTGYPVNIQLFGGSCVYKLWQWADFVENVEVEWEALTLPPTAAPTQEPTVIPTEQPTIAAPDPLYGPVASPPTSRSTSVSAESESPDFQSINRGLPTDNGTTQADSGSAQADNGCSVDEFWWKEFQFCHRVNCTEVYGEERPIFSMESKLCEPEHIANCRLGDFTYDPNSNRCFQPNMSDATHPSVSPVDLIDKVRATPEKCNNGKIAADKVSCECDDGWRTKNQQSIYDFKWCTEQYIEPATVPPGFTKIKETMYKFYIFFGIYILALLLAVIIHWVHGPTQEKRAKAYMIKDSISSSSSITLYEESSENTEFTNDESGSTSGDGLRIEYDEPITIKKTESSGKETLKTRIRRMSTNALEGLARALSEIKRSKRRTQTYIPVKRDAVDHNQIEKEEAKYYDPPIVKLRKKDRAANLNSPSILEDVK